MLRGLLIACLVVLLVLLVLGEMYKGDGNNDPRLELGRTTLIFHAHDQIVIARPDHSQTSFDYAPIRVAEIGCFVAAFLSLSLIALWPGKSATSTPKNDPKS